MYECVREFAFLLSEFELKEEAVYYSASKLCLVFFVFLLSHIIH